MFCNWLEFDLVLQLFILLHWTLSYIPALIWLLNPVNWKKNITGTFSKHLVFLDIYLLICFIAGNNWLIGCELIFFSKVRNVEWAPCIVELRREVRLSLYPPKSKILFQFKHWAFLYFPLHIPIDYFSLVLDHLGPFYFIFGHF